MGEWAGEKASAGTGRMGPRSGLRGALQQKGSGQGVLSASRGVRVALTKRKMVLGYLFV